MKNALKKGTELLRSREISLMLVMVLLCALIQWRSGGKFLTPTVINQLTQNYAYTAVLAFGMLLVLLIGGIDISIGATLALSGMSTCLMMRDGFITNPVLAFAFSTLVGLRSVHRRGDLQGQGHPHHCDIGSAVHIPRTDIFYLQDPMGQLR